MFDGFGSSDLPVGIATAADVMEGSEDEFDIVPTYYCFWIEGGFFIEKFRSRMFMRLNIVRKRNENSN